MLVCCRCCTSLVGNILSVCSQGHANSVVWSYSFVLTFCYKNGSLIDSHDTVDCHLRAVYLVPILFALPGQSYLFFIFQLLPMVIFMIVRCTINLMTPEGKMGGEKNLYHIQYTTTIVSSSPHTWQLSTYWYIKTHCTVILSVRFFFFLSANLPQDRPLPGSVMTEPCTRCRTYSPSCMNYKHC